MIVLGITAFETEYGLFALMYMEDMLPADGHLVLKDIMSRMEKDDWCRPVPAKEGRTHTSPMVLAEIILYYTKNKRTNMCHIDRVFCSPRHSYRNITSFSADKGSLRWIKNYLSETLKSNRQNAMDHKDFGQWYKVEDYHKWQDHMEKLISCLDRLLEKHEDPIELLCPAKMAGKII